MTLASILEKTAEFLGIDVNFANASDTENFLVKCGNSIICQLVEEYTDIKICEQIVSCDKKIYYSTLSKSVKNILSVAFDGKKVAFCEYPTYITVPFDEKFTVKYSYTLGEAEASDEISLPPKYTTNILAVGVAGEFCYRKGLYKEAEAYQKRYVCALKNLERTAKNINIKVGG